MFSKILPLLCLMLLSPSFSSAQQVIDLWPDGLPNSNGIDTTLPFDDATQNFKPRLTVFHPADSVNNGRTVLCLPGGGYSHLATAHEGTDWAPFFCQRGFTFVMLHYRMPHGHTEVPVSDATEALRVIRSHATDWHIDPQRVGIMGSSAGGHLASTIATHADSTTAPAFQILFYPVITMQSDYTHQGSRDNLLGRTPSEAEVQAYSNQLQVTAHTPRTLLLLSDDDTVVPSPNSVNYYLALRRHHVPASLHIYPSGGHGWGFRPAFRYHRQMTDELAAWLQTLP